ncbi:MAG: SRPBCC family protein [Vicinamibacterales bacterium]
MDSPATTADQAIQAARQLAPNLEDWERAASIAAGAGLLVLGAIGGRRGAVAWLAGAGLVARGASGYCPVSASLGRERRRDDPRRALAGPRGAHVHESVTIRASVETLWNYWRDPANLPRLLPHLSRVERLDDTRSRWTIAGPAGAELRWDAEIINEIPLDTIAWKSLPGADVASAGSVTFVPLARGRTQVTVTMQYAPPAGNLGASLARLVGRDAGARVREALRQLKQQLEAGEIPTTTGQPAGARSRAYEAARRLA